MAEDYKKDANWVGKAISPCKQGCSNAGMCIVTDCADWYKWHACQLESALSTSQNECSRLREVNDIQAQRIGLLEQIKKEGQGYLVALQEANEKLASLASTADAEQEPCVRKNVPIADSDCTPYACRDGNNCPDNCPGYTPPSDTEASDG